MNNKQQIIINIAKDFTVYPGARYRSDGKHSGEQFYEDVLKPKMDKVINDPKTTITINFDGTFGYASSFISEVFLRVAKDYKNKELVLRKLKFISNDDPLLIRSIHQIIENTVAL